MIFFTFILEKYNFIDINLNRPPLSFPYGLLSTLGKKEIKILLSFI